MKDKLDTADSYLKENNDQGRVNAATCITEGIELLNNRQKLVKLADMSENVWRVVQEYETHQLAEDSDDEKRIVKAEARAAKKVKDERAKKRSSRRFILVRGIGRVRVSLQSQGLEIGAADPGSRETVTSAGNPVTGSENARPRLLS